MKIRELVVLLNSFPPDHEVLKVIDDEQGGLHEATLGQIIGLTEIHVFSADPFTQEINFENITDSSIIPNALVIR